MLSKNKPMLMTKFRLLTFLLFLYAGNCIFSQNEDIVNIPFSPAFTAGTSGTWQVQTFQILASDLPNAVGSAPYTFQEYIYTLKSVTITAQKSLPYLQLQLKAPGGEWFTIIDEFGSDRFAAGSLQHMETTFISNQYGGGNPRPRYVNDNQAPNCEGGSPWNIGYYGAGKQLPTTGGTGSNFTGDFSLLQTWGANIVGTWSVRIRNWSGINSGYTTNSNPPELVNLKLKFGKNDSANIITTAGNNCIDAIQLTSNGLYSGNTTGYTGNPSQDPRMSGVNPCNWNASMDNTVWLQFTAQSDSLHFIISGVNCNTANQKIQAIVVRGVPGDPNPCALNGMGPAYWEQHPVSGGCPTDFYGTAGVGYCNGRAVNLEFFLNDLVIGDTYYVILDGNAGSLCSFIFDVVSGLNPPTCFIDAGPNIDVCYTDSIFISQADTMMINSFVWTSSGDGIFLSPSSLNPTYIPGTNDINNGHITLYLNATSDCGNLIDSTTITINQAPIITLNTNQNPCSADSITITASGGNSYLWNNNSTQQSIVVLPDSTTTYFVTVTSINGCTNSDSITVTPSHNNMEISSIIVNSNCIFLNSGSIDITVNGGLAPYQYMWNNGNTNEDLYNIPAGSYSITVTDANNCTSVESFTVNQDANGMIVNTIIQHISCFGMTNGIATIVVSNAPAPFTYQWSNGSTDSTASNLAAGNYQFTVTDADGCSYISQISILQPSPLVSTITSNSTSCYGLSNGMIRVTVIGGTQPYNYTWSNGAENSQINNMPAGSYTVTISDNNNCESIANGSIQQPDSIIMNAQLSYASCSQANGNIQLTVIGGTPAYSYQWSHQANLNQPTATNLPPGTYHVTVTDSRSCTFIYSANIGDNPSPVVELVSKNDEFCMGNNGRLEVIAMGGTHPLTYAWSNGDFGNEINHLNSGNYVVVITDNNGCTASDSYYINRIPKPEITVTSKGDEHCNQSDGFINITVSPPNNYNFIWIPNISNTTSAQNIHSGTYYIIAHDSICSDTISTIINHIAGPIADFNTVPTTTARLPEARFRMVNHSERETSWFWDFGDGNSSNEETPIHYYQESGDFFITLIVTDDYGCSDTARQKVNVIDDIKIWIPSAFTNDNDGLNETFGPHGRGYDPDRYEMKIFDRWGMCVFTSYQFEHRWDGTVNGKNITDDLVFVYRIVVYDLTGKDYIFVGRVTKLGTHFR